MKRPRSTQGENRDQGEPHTGVAVQIPRFSTLVRPRRRSSVSPPCQFGLRQGGCQTAVAMHSLDLPAHDPPRWACQTVEAVLQRPFAIDPPESFLNKPLCFSKGLWAGEARITPYSAIRRCLIQGDTAATFGYCSGPKSSLRQRSRTSPARSATTSSRARSAAPLGVQSGSAVSPARSAIYHRYHVSRLYLITRGIA